jgi:hypothetical protein
VKTRDEWQIQVRMRDGLLKWVGLEADHMTQAEAEAEALIHFRGEGFDPVAVIKADQIVEAGRPVPDPYFTGFRSGPARPDLVDIRRVAEFAAQETDGGAWAWDGSELIELNHDNAIGIQCANVTGSNAGAHIARMDPLTTLALVDWIEELEDRLEQDGG